MHDVVKIYRLISGEELIGKEHGQYELTDVLSLVLVPSGTNGQASYGFLPYSPLTKSEVKRFKDEHIVWTDDPVDLVLESYHKAISPIVQPDKSIILN